MDRRSPLYDPALSVRERAEYLLAQLTIEEKFTVTPCDLEIYIESEGKKLVEPGAYRIYAGGSCLDEAVSADITL